MKPTRPSLLLAAGLLLAGVAALSLRFSYSSLPELPANWAITPAVLAVIEGMLAWTTSNRLTGRHGAAPLNPLVAARFAALARASSLVGAALTGGWIGALAYLLHQHGSLAAVSHDRRIAILGIITGLALTAAALWLEWVCRVKHDSSDPADAEPFSS